MRASVLFVFLDGVGLGPPGPHNPLATQSFPAFERLANGTPWTREASPVRDATHLFHPLDATLGVEGLPQSGTGQATLFTGTNCAKIVGRHFGPFPHSKTKPVIAEHNIFRQVQALGETSTAFANAYPPRFFEHAEAQDRWTVTTLCCRAAGVRLRTEQDLRAHEALTADLTGAAWRRHLGRDTPEITEAEAGRQLAALGRRHAFTLFEYYLTDKVGHGRLPERTATDVLQALDRFFGGLLDALDTDRQLLVVTSDHGNVEDLSTKTHTRHPVPLIAWGTGADHFRDTHDLTDVSAAILDVLSSPLLAS